MHSWDVVNEAVDLRSGRVDAMRNSPWLALAGDDYIELAFRTARDADPTALLCYNEFGIELETQENEDKRAMVLLLLRRLKSRQVPVDALGIQSHLAPAVKGIYGEGLLRFMAAVRELDMQIFISEMDVNDQTLPPQVSQRDQIVADTYDEYLGTALQEPAVTVVQTWGITDRYSWMNEMPQPNREDRMMSRPLLFDDQYRAKPAFYAVRNSFDRRRVEQMGMAGQVRGTGPMVTPPDRNSPFRQQPYLPAPGVKP
jgi:endo-1,4-beta-xylanase